MQNLATISCKIDEYVEIRYHKRIETIIDARSGALRKEREIPAGAGVRSLVTCWGFVSTTDVSKEGLQNAATQARGSQSRSPAQR